MCLHKSADDQQIAEKMLRRRWTVFWDRVAWVKDVFVNNINRKTHLPLHRVVAELIEPEDVVLKCACGTGLLSGVIAEKCRELIATDFSE